MTTETEHIPRGHDVGAAWRYINRNGESRRYVVASTAVGQPGIAIFLRCLEPAHKPVEGYVGGESREARVLAKWLREPPSLLTGGWLEGHE